MDGPLAWTPESTPAVVALLTVTVTYTVFHFAASPRTLQPLLERRFDEDTAALYAGVLQKVLGFVLLGVVPWTVAALWLPDNPSNHGVRLGDPSSTLAIVGVAALVFVPVNTLLARTPGFQKSYPQIRLPRWSTRGLVLNAASWALYLIGYEYFFRGFFLYSMVDAFGTWPAIMITTAVYVAVHLPKNAAECLGCIPMGIVFAAITLYTDSVLAAIGVHVLVAISAESAAIVQNKAVWPRG